MKKRIVFKCRFGEKDGWGHVVRCSALADAFLSRGWETLLWGTGEFFSLPADVARSFAGESEQGQEEASILFIDEMYTEQVELEQVAKGWRLRNPRGIVAGVDDMQRRSMAGFDLVLNTEIGLREAEYKATQVLLGERFALLRTGFREPMKGIDFLDMADSIPVLVMLGGTDAFGYLPKTLHALGSLREPSIAPIVVAGNSQGFESCLDAFAVSRVLGRVDAAELAAWMRFCRAAVIACGSSLYEVAALALPFVGLSVVDNQTASARKVDSNWGMPVCHFESGTFSEEELRRKLVWLLGKPKETYSEVDTEGASRVAQALVALLSDGRAC